MSYLKHGLVLDGVLRPIAGSLPWDQGLLDVINASLAKGPITILGKKGFASIQEAIWTAGRDVMSVGMLGERLYLHRGRVIVVEETGPRILELVSKYVFIMDLMNGSYYGITRDDKGRILTKTNETGVRRYKERKYVLYCDLNMVVSCSNGRVRVSQLNQVYFDKTMDVTRAAVNCWGVLYLAFGEHLTVFDISQSKIVFSQSLGSPIVDLSHEYALCEDGCIWSIVGLVMIVDVRKND